MESRARSHPCQLDRSRFTTFALTIVFCVSALLAREVAKRVDAGPASKLSKLLDERRIVCEQNDVLFRKLTLDIRVLPEYLAKPGLATDRRSHFVRVFDEDTESAPLRPKYLSNL